VVGSTVPMICSCGSRQLTVQRTPLQRFGMSTSDPFSVANSAGLTPTCSCARSGPTPLPISLLHLFTPVCRSGWRLVDRRCFLYPIFRSAIRPGRYRRQYDQLRRRLQHVESIDVTFDPRTNIKRGFSGPFGSEANGKPSCISLFFDFDLIDCGSTTTAGASSGFRPRVGLLPAADFAPIVAALH
jgi:hypothetical protein